MSRQLSGERELRVEIRYAAGNMIVRSTDGGSLYRLHLEYDEAHFEPIVEYEGGLLRMSLEGVRKGLSFPRRTRGGEIRVDLAAGIPMTLEMEMGAVDAELDLGGLALSDLELQTGASRTRLDVSAPNTHLMRRALLVVGAAEFTARRLGNLNADLIEVSAGVGDVTLDLTGEWRRDGRVSVDIGLGGLELVFPEGVGVRLRRDTFLAALDAEGLVKRGDAYYSVDWDSAPYRISVDVEAAFGRLAVRWAR